MSWHACEDPREKGGPAPSTRDPVETAIVPRSRDLGGFEVRRALPARGRRTVGPFIFLDQAGPNEFLLGQGLDVRPHPHIGLATVTYLFRGELLHRDSLGTVQAIRPGEVNWMTAGRGIAHSERTSPEERQRGARLFGIQSWVALPEREEEREPAFAHYEAAALPTVEDGGARVRLIAGSLYGQRSPVRVFSETLYAEAVLESGARLPLDAEHEERALYLAEGAVEIAGLRHEPGQLLVLRPGDALSVTALEAARFMVLGGAPLESKRYIWWNFVSSSRERIEAAKADWRAGRFVPVTDDSESVPLPDDPGP